MKNSEYWQGRFVELEEARHSLATDVYKEIEPAFDSALREIDKSIEKWIYRISENNGISMNSARKLLEKNQLAEFKWGVNEYIKKGRENAVNQMWIKELENASAKVHVGRLEALRIEIQQQIEIAFGKEFEEVNILSKLVYKEGYYRSGFEIQRGLGIGHNLASIDENKLSKLISKPWAADGKNFSDRIWSNKASMVNELYNELVRTCIRGEAPDQAIKHMSQFVDKKFKNAKSRAGALVMTEQAFFSSAAQKDCFNELGVDEFEIVATLDSHTSAICQEMDGKHFPMKEYEPGVTAPPFHVWCRSVTCPYFDDEFTTDGMRAARDEDGKYYKVPEEMTYPEWKQAYVKDANANRNQNLQQIGFDKEQYKKYKSIFGNDFPQTFEKFREMKYNDIKEWESFKVLKQQRLNQMDFKDMKPLLGKLGNKETRLWYKAHDEMIPNLIDITKSLEEQARQAHAIRNQNRTDARNLMKDQAKRKELDQSKPNKTFEKLVEHKIKKYGMTENEIYEDIIRSSTTTNPEYDRLAGVKDEGIKK